jgi:hypothetical protein
VEFLPDRGHAVPANAKALAACRIKGEMTFAQLAEHVHPNQITALEGPASGRSRLILGQAPGFTVSQISLLRTCWHCSLAARASREALGEGADQASFAWW